MSHIITKTDDDRRMHGLLDTPMRKMCSISPRPEFRHFKPVYDVSFVGLLHFSVLHFESLADLSHDQNRLDYPSVMHERN